MFQAKQVFLRLSVLDDRQTLLNLKDKQSDLSLKITMPRMLFQQPSIHLSVIDEVVHRNSLIFFYTFLSPLAVVFLCLSAASVRPSFVYPPGCALSFLSPLLKLVPWLALSPAVRIPSLQGYSQPLQQETADWGCLKISE